MALLRADGLVEEAGHAGVRVAPLDVAAMRRHHEIRAALDGLAAVLEERAGEAGPGRLAQRG